MTKDRDRDRDRDKDRYRQKNGQQKTETETKDRLLNNYIKTVQGDTSRKTKKLGNRKQTNRS